MNDLKISDFGEKRLIAEFIHPLFNIRDDVGGVGDDCAMLEGADGEVWLFSTDRVPADLISFKLGILDYYGLGQYLARLNLSDIAACGGKPLALLLNLGLPADLQYSNFKSLCQGFGQVAALHDCSVLGGDITSSSELSISATSIGKTTKGRVLTRRGAQTGDSIFVSRPLGLTPAAFAFHLRLAGRIDLLSEDQISTLNRQFTSLDPLIKLSLELAKSNKCSACMDNSDGIGQSLLELSVASKAAFIVARDSLEFPFIVEKVAQTVGEDLITLAFGPGSDFSLVGTLKGRWSQEAAAKSFGPEVKIIGHVEEGNGLYLESSGDRKSLHFSGWNYFMMS